MYSDGATRLRAGDSRGEGISDSQDKPLKLKIPLLEFPSNFFGN